jgi:hypothetical protein
MTNAIPKWTEERVENLVSFVGEDSPVTQKVVADAAERLETSTRSVSSKLRKMGYEVEKANTVSTKAYSEDQEATLRNLLEDNPSAYTYAEIAEMFEEGIFSAKSIQGKILSMELTDKVKPAEKVEAVKTYTEEEENLVITMAGNGDCLEDIAAAVDKTLNSVRGKCLSLVRAEVLESIPVQRDKVAPKEDWLDALGDIEEMTVEEIASASEKTPRGVRTTLTRRRLKCADYDGEAKAAKAAA